MNRTVAIMILAGTYMGYGVGGDAGGVIGFCMGLIMGLVQECLQEYETMRESCTTGKENP